MRGFLTSPDDLPQHFLDVLEQLVVPESDYAIAVLGQHSGAVLVNTQFRMLTSIEFDYDHRLLADEVGVVASDRNLTTELQSFQAPIAQVQPKPEFGINLALA